MTEILARLTIYEHPPTSEILLNDLEHLLSSRISLLSGIEHIVHHETKDTDLHKEIKDLEEKYIPLHSDNYHVKYNLNQERTNDTISHFIARLRFSLNDGDRRWFITYECILFKYRFQSLMPDERAQFLKQSMPWLKEIVCDDAYPDSGPCYPVPFEDAMDLVARRAVLLKTGYAYVPRTEIGAVIVNCFRKHLETEMAGLAKTISRLVDTRLLSLIQNTPRSSKPPSIERDTVVGEKLTAASVDNASRYFPPCMVHLHRHLKSESHLKYGGRMQYGLFLKSLGLSMDDAILFWKQAFSKKVPEDAFQKNYLYNIRHSYGQEGKRADYTPWSCKKIISEHIGATDHHGCPFKHFNAENLHTHLTSMVDGKVSEEAINDIVDMARNNNHQMACTMLAEVLSGTSMADPVAYPHQFYNHVRKSIP